MSKREEVNTFLSLIRALGIKEEKKKCFKFLLGIVFVHRGVNSSTKFWTRNTENLLIKKSIKKF